MIQLNLKKDFER